MAPVAPPTVDNLIRFTCRQARNCPPLRTTASQPADTYMRAGGGVDMDGGLQEAVGTREGWRPTELRPLLGLVGKRAAGGCEKCQCRIGGTGKERAGGQGFNGEHGRSSSTGGGERIQRCGVRGMACVSARVLFVHWGRHIHPPSHCDKEGAFFSFPYDSTDIFHSPGE